MDRILVPLDGSRLAEQALGPALLLARNEAVHVRLVHVLDFLHVFPDCDTQEEAQLHACARDDAQAYFERLALMHKDELAHALSSTILDGSAIPAILQESRSWQADLLVMSTHGYGPVDRAWLGSVTDALIRESNIPIFVVRASETQPDTTPSEPVRHILIPLDGSAPAEQILAPAGALAQLTGARVTLLRVVHPWVRAIRPMAAAKPLPELREKEIARRRTEARDYLARIAQRMDRASVDTVVAETSDAGEINKYIEQHAIDLVALATHGRSGLKRIALGSVADKLIRGASVPVLVVRPRA